MRITAEPFWTPKRGSTDEEYEDAVWPPERQDYETDCARFAVADGATESSFARLWANLLVQAVADRRVSLDGLAQDIASLQTQWRDAVTSRDLPWYAEEKARQGAFAALVAFELGTPEPSGNQERVWRAAAIGDSCLFHIRGGKLLAHFPVDHSAAFGACPFLVGSVRNDDGRLIDQISQCHGKWEPGDTFYLMTDALACWFLREVEGDCHPEKTLDDLGNADGFSTFCGWIDSLRENGAIRNDDCTLLTIRVS